MWTSRFQLRVGGWNSGLQNRNGGGGAQAPSVFISVMCIYVSVVYVHIDMCVRVCMCHIWCSEASLKCLCSPSALLKWVSVLFVTVCTRLADLQASRCLLSCGCSDPNAPRFTWVLGTWTQVFSSTYPYAISPAQTQVLKNIANLTNFRDSISFNLGSHKIAIFAF